MIKKGNSRRALKPVPDDLSRPEPMIPLREAHSTPEPKEKADKKEVSTKIEKPASEASPKSTSKKKDVSIRNIDFFIPITPGLHDAISGVAGLYQTDAADILAMLVKRAHEYIRDQKSDQNIKKLKALSDEHAHPIKTHRVRNAHITKDHLDVIRVEVDPMGIRSDKDLMAIIYQRIFGQLTKVT